MNNVLSMFESIKEAINNTDKKQTSNLKDILSLKPGNTYTVRFVPNVENPGEKTFFHHFTHGWTSFATGQYVSALSPQTFGERDPIAEERYRIYRTGTPEEKEKIQAVRRIEQWLVNVYVVDDPSNPDNNGKVKILRYGKQLDKIVKDAISGETAEEFGARIFDLTKNGVNFKIKVEKQGDYPSYSSSRFTTAGSDLKLSEDAIQKIYESTHDLEQLFRLRTFDELKQMFDEHYHCRVTESKEENVGLPSVDEAISELTSKSVTASKAQADISETDFDELLKDIS